MEDENENDKEERGSSVSYPVGESSSSFAGTTTPYSSRGVGGCYSWGDVNRNGGASCAGPVDTDHQVKTGEVLVRLYPVHTCMCFFSLPHTHELKLIGWVSVLCI